MNFDKQRMVLFCSTSIGFFVASGTDALAVTGAGGGGETMLSLLIKGGPVMIPLGLCSIIALTIALQSFIVLRRRRIMPRGFIAGLQEILGGKHADLQKGLDYCGEKASPLANICRAGILKARNNPEQAGAAIEDATTIEIRRLKRGLRGLNTIARIAPLLGLLGTVYGMIRAFHSAAVGGGVGKGEQLAHGIYEALITTATGLTIAIPTLLVFYMLTTRIDVFAEEMEEACNKLLDQYVENRPAGTK